jgi:hypothetical protein
MLLTRLKDGSADTSLEPVLTMDNRYPGTIRINIKNPTPPNIIRDLLSNNIPIGTIAIRMKKRKRRGSFLRFLNGYLIEFKMMDETSIKSPHLKMNTGFLS